jgi:hypothetical protein
MALSARRRKQIMMGLFLLVGGPAALATVLKACGFA